MAQVENKERSVFVKMFLSNDCSKEEQWLNDMAKAGYRLVSVGFCHYVFEDCDPREFSIHVHSTNDVHHIPEAAKGIFIGKVGHKSYYLSRSSSYFYGSCFNLGIAMA